MITIFFRYDESGQPVSVGAHPAWTAGYAPNLWIKLESGWWIIDWVQCATAEAVYVRVRAPKEENEDLNELLRAIQIPAQNPDVSR